MSRADALTYLFSSRTAMRSGFFQGYAHVGTDFVVGQAGADAYRDATGRDVLPGEDGCYVTVVHTADGLVVGVDHAGLKKLFVWRSDSDWCVSNSLTVLRDHVESAMGVSPLTVNDAQVAGLHVIGSPTEQLSHHRTILNEVRLLPLRRMLLITDRGPVAMPTSGPQTVGDYDDDLCEYIATWRSRLLTLSIDSRMSVAVDLSGGLDSRVVFALAGNSVSGRDLDHAMTLVSGKGAHQRADHAVAASIADRYGMSLNRRPRVAAERYSDGEAFDAWRELNLGVYLPIYQPRARLSPWHVNLSGLGGENQRPFYPQVPVHEFVSSWRVAGPTVIAEPWRSSTQSLLRSWTNESAPLIRYYREFRGRIHGGMFAQTKVNVMPLASRLMDPLSVAGHRAFFDVMQNTLPDLVDMPFDVPSKSLGAEDREQVRRLRRLPDPTAGIVYADDPASTRTHDATPFVDRIADLAERSADEAGIHTRGLFGEEWVERTLDTVRAARKRGVIAQPRSLNNVSRLITAAWALARVR